MRVSLPTDNSKEVQYLAGIEIGAQKPNVDVLYLGGALFEPESTKNSIVVELMSADKYRFYCAATDETQEPEASE